MLNMKTELIWSYVKETTPYLRNKLTWNIPNGHIKAFNKVKNPHHHPSPKGPQQNSQADLQAFCHHWVDTSAGSLLVPDGIIIQYYITF